MKSIVRCLVSWLAIVLVTACNSLNSREPGYASNHAIDTLLIHNVLFNRLDIEYKPIIDVDIINQTGDKSRISDQGSCEPTLVLFFSELSCFECVSKQITYLSSFLKNESGVKVIIINTSEDLRSAYAILKQNDVDIAYYSTHFQNIGFDRNQHPGPLFFILDHDFCFKYSYEPLIQINEFTNKYLMNVNEKFFSPEASNTNQ